MKSQNSKYPNKQKRKGFWKIYERARIKDYRKVWYTALQFIKEGEIPFQFSKRGRKPNLTRKELVCMAILHVYCDNDFRETEYAIRDLTGKSLDHTNCVRWFGRLTQSYVNNLVFKLHKKIIGIDDVGDYIADSTKATCDRLEVKDVVGEKQFKHITWKLHILVQYIFSLGLISIVSVFSSNGNVNDSPPLRNRLLDKERVKKGKKLHADKGYFGKANIKKCQNLNLQPNIVPKDIGYSDRYLKKYVKNEYNNEARKQTRGLVEGVFGGFETETDMKLRCRKPKHRDIYLALLALKHNLRTYLRATALSFTAYFAPTPVSCQVLWI